MLPGAVEGKLSRILQASEGNREDFVTSSIFGSLIYFTNDQVKRRLSAAFGPGLFEFEESDVVLVELWPRFDKDVVGHVEPDVVIDVQGSRPRRFIVEVKWDSVLMPKQPLEQWLYCANGATRHIFVVRDEAGAERALALSSIEAERKVDRQFADEWRDSRIVLSWGKVAENLRSHAGGDRWAADISSVLSQLSKMTVAPSSSSRPRETSRDQRKTTSVFCGVDCVGVLGRDDSGLFFRYDPSWLTKPEAFPVSSAMPLRRGPYPAEIVDPWLRSLLPQSPINTSICAHLRADDLDVSETDAVRLLSKVGRDTAGALSFGRPVEQQGRLRAVACGNDLKRLIHESVSRPFLAGSDGVSMVLTGSHKLPVVFDETGISIPLDGAASTHILKPGFKLFPGLVQNEAVCLRLAARIGLDAVAVTTGVADDLRYLLVERFDRRIIDGELRRLHRQDFCQALGRPPEHRYRTNPSGRPGVSLREMFDFSREHMRPSEILTLFDQIAFNMIVGNTRAHAQKYSMFVTGQGVSMAPVHSALCSDVYERSFRSMPQTIMGRFQAENLQVDHWRQFATTVNLDPDEIPARVAGLADAVLREIAAAVREVESMPAGGSSILESVRSAVCRRAARIKERLSAREAGEAYEGSLPGMGR